MDSTTDYCIFVKDLEMRYEDHIVMEHLTFKIPQQKIFVVMGKSGCGKSTLLKHLVGLNQPSKGEIFYKNESFTQAAVTTKAQILRRVGVLYQNGALWSGLTLLENITLPLEFYTSLSKTQMEDLASMKLSLVGLKGHESFYPHQLSGGMRKRAGLARALALDPEILFFDEPSAGLDPVTARHLEDLIVQIRDGLRTSIVLITHDLSTIFRIADEAIFLDTHSKTLLAQGSPLELLNGPVHPRVKEFLSPL